MTLHNHAPREHAQEVWDHIPDDGTWITLSDLAALVGSSPSSIGRRLNAIKHRVARSTSDTTEKGIKEVRRLPQFCRYPFNLPVR
jgi:hypothetical protein